MNQTSVLSVVADTLSMGQLPRYLIISMLLVATGCFMDSKITSLNPASDSSSSPGTAPKLIAATEMVSGASPKSNSVNRGYIKNSTVGSSSSILYRTSQNRGYRLYLTAQGQILSGAVKQ